MKIPFAGHTIPLIYTMLAAYNTALKARYDRTGDPKYAVPERIEFVETIPKTSVGKIDKKHLRVMLGAGVPEPPN